MFCRNCGKEIEENSRFCKFCGTLLYDEPENEQDERAEVEEKTTPQPMIGSRRNRLIILICIVMIALGAAVFGLYKAGVFSGDKGQDQNYDKYIGTWQKEGTSDVEWHSGVKLEITTVIDHTITFSLGVYEGGGSYNGTEVENIATDVNDGKGSFDFADAINGKSGKGTIALYDSKIKLTITMKDGEQDSYVLIKVDDGTGDITGTPTTETKETKAVKSAGYILPDSNVRYLTSDDLEGLSSAELRIARNEILARHGRKFNDSGLMSYFEKKSWYDGTVDPQVFDDLYQKDLNQYETRNIETIKAEEDRR